jgi:hypothetical protein
VKHRIDWKVPRVTSMSPRTKRALAQYPPAGATELERAATIEESLQKAAIGLTDAKGLYRTLIRQRSYERDAQSRRTTRGASTSSPHRRTVQVNSVTASQRSGMPYRAKQRASLGLELRSTQDVRRSIILRSPAKQTELIESLRVPQGDMSQARRLHNALIRNEERRDLLEVSGHFAEETLVMCVNVCRTDGSWDAGRTRYLTTWV